VSLIAADPDGIVFLWNAEAERMFGWAAAEAVGRPVLELFVSSHNVAAPPDIWQTLRGGPAWEGEWRLLHREGHEVTVHVINTPLFDADGAPSGCLGMSVDVTRDRHGSMAVLEAVVRHSPISVTVVGGDDRIVMTMGDVRTDEAAKAAFVGRKISDFTSDPAYLSMIAHVRTGQPGREVVTYGGRSYDTTGVPLPDSVAGPGGAAFVATDVTEQLAESRRFQALVENLQEVTGILNRDGTVRYISPAIERLSGFTADEVIKGSSMTEVHPDDSAALGEAFQHVLNHPDAVVTPTYRVLHRDGSWRQVEQTIVNRLDDPSIGGLLVVGRDVTARVAAEGAVRDANQRLLAANEDLVAVNRIHAVLSEAGNAMLHADDAMELLDEACRILVAVGGFATAAFTTAASSSGEVLVLAHREADQDRNEPGSMMSEVVDAVRAGWPAWYAPPAPSEERPVGAEPGESRVVLFPLERRDDPLGLLAVCPHPGSRPVSDGERALLLGLARDLAFALDAISSDRKRAEAMEVGERRAAQQATVSRLGRMAMVADAGEVLEAAMAALTSFDLRQVLMYEALPEGDAVLVRAAAGEQLPIAHGDVVPRSAVPIADAVLSSGAAVMVSDLNSETRYRLPSDSPFVRSGSAVGIPVRVKGITVAVVLVRRFESNAFDTHDVAFYESVANVVGGAMERRQYEAELRHDATHHRLTGLPNRVLVHDRLTQALARCRRRRSGHVAVLVVDIDALKSVNDRLGRDAGDHLLALAGSRLIDAIRPSDTVAHSAGDEFVVLCEDLADPGEAAAVATRITERMREPFMVGAREIAITVSVGIAVGSGKATVDELLRDADVAMYRAKETGRNRFEIFNEALRAQVGRRKDIEQGLHDAVDRGEFVVAYQPVVDLATGQVSEAEALLRWTLADGTQISPTEFIPIAEETGLIVSIGAWVLTRACEDAVRWNEQFGVDSAVGVAVNLSARQISHPDLVPTVVRALEVTGLAPHLLRLEITETALMEEGDDGVATLKALDALGVHLCVDDFGTGYSSLMYLRRYPVRVLKVDRFFIAGLGKNSEDEAIAVAVIALAHSLGLSATAEGIETVEQLERLRALDCDSGQGYLWSRAVPFTEFVPLIEALRASATDPIGEQCEPVPPVTDLLAVGTRRAGRGAPTVVLVDDSPSDRRLMRIALEASATFSVVGEAASGEAAIAMAADTHPDLLVLDMSMTGMNGLEAVGPIHDASPATRVVFLSGFLSSALAQAAIHAGAYMNFDKSVPFETVVTQLASALSGDNDRAAGAPARSEQFRAAPSAS
jgi:diguanylate cyclase (GGDEF)-like protein/PAS domain S-box-containing protein